MKNQLRTLYYRYNWLWCWEALEYKMFRQDQAAKKLLILNRMPQGEAWDNDVLAYIGEQDNWVDWTDDKQGQWVEHRAQHDSW